MITEERNKNVEKLAIIAQKLSTKGFTFNERVLYVDNNEIRYYSKVPPGFQNNIFTHLVKLPKAGVPTELAELEFVPKEWMSKKKKYNAIKVIFPEGAQISYDINQSDPSKLLRRDKKKQAIDLRDHISNVKDSNENKKVCWVFSFKKPLELQNFCKIVEEVTNPDNVLNFSKQPQPLMRLNNNDSALEPEDGKHIRKTKYVKDLNISDNQANPYNKAATRRWQTRLGDSDYDSEDENKRDRDLAEDLKRIRSKVGQQKKRYSFNKFI